MIKHIDITRATFRTVDKTSTHVTYGIWINGAKCGNLTVRIEEMLAFEKRLRRGGFLWRED